MSAKQQERSHSQQQDACVTSGRGLQHSAHGYRRDERGNIDPRSGYTRAAATPRRNSSEQTKSSLSREPSTSGRQGYVDNNRDRQDRQLSPVLERLCTARVLCVLGAQIVNQLMLSSSLHKVCFAALRAFI